MGTYSQYSTLSEFTFEDTPVWTPPDGKERVDSYIKYDQMYWNDPRQYEIRVLQGEQPIYIPNARVIVDTTSHYLLKGLQITVEDQESFPDLVLALKNFLNREQFYARFSVAKHTGVAQGDFVMHMTANPLKMQGERLSLNSVAPESVYPVWDTDQPDKMVACNLVNTILEKDSAGEIKPFIHKLTYVLVESPTGKQVTREESLYQMTPPWYQDDAVKVRDILPLTPLDPLITSIPVYWFKNLAWGNQSYGSSELRGIESLCQAVSQGTTDTQVALALEGLGVYATDGGRPINDAGTEIDWTIAPGGVMEVAPGSKFWRVEGVNSISPMKDQLDRLEEKIFISAALSDVAMGNSDVSISSSGIALAIQFTPTLAKIEERDTAGLAKLTQLFYDWKIWHQVFEQQGLEGEIVPQIGAKLPVDRVGILNELNNMLDRHVISRAFYRQRMTELGYTFPATMEADIVADVQLAAIATPLSKDTELNNAVNNSNNASRPNESAGTEATPVSPANPNG